MNRSIFSLVIPIRHNLTYEELKLPKEEAIMKIAVCHNLTYEELKHACMIFQGNVG